MILAIIVQPKSLVSLLVFLGCCCCNLGALLFILNNKSVQYKVLEFIGEGGFGKVAKCVNMNTNENTAIKILKDVNYYAEEVEMLENIRTLDQEKNNLVRFMDSFIVDDKSCIAFECLDRSLWDLMLQRKKRLTLNEIRPITRQLLVALNALKGIGLLYTDLKHDNVMLVNHKDEPFRVKLIDFGLAMPASEVWEGMIVQPCAYRAPEVSLGLPISEAIDMWSLGCLLATLFFCKDIFKGQSSYDVMKTICSHQVLTPLQLYHLPLPHQQRPSLFWRETQPARTPFPLTP
uniref:Protein kinase domain-containing protein n=1 Tax=Gasterosteus aculeatus aculeatus TaxID=481459 RepID=A0AAQ4PLH1_GASAC